MRGIIILNITVCRLVKVRIIKHTQMAIEKAFCDAKKSVKIDARVDYTKCESFEELRNRIMFAITQQYI